MKINNVAIIGSGLGGLSAAIRIAAKGHRVTIFEQQETPGGKARQIQTDGFTFDAGPSLFTLPEEVFDLLRLAGMNPEECLNVYKLDPICNYIFSDGTNFKSPGNPEKWKQAVLPFLVDPRQIIQYQKDARKIYEITTPVFLNQSLHLVKNYFKKHTLKGILNLGSIHALTILNEYHEKMFHDKRLVQLFNRYATYNGSDPYQAPATLSVISHIEGHLGAWYPKGGIYEIARQLFLAAQRLGVIFNFGTKAQYIENLFQEGYAVNYSKDGLDCRDKFSHIIFNVDIHHVYNTLIPWAKKPIRILSRKRSSSGIIFYWGMAKSFPELDLHNIFFSQDYHKEFQQIFRDGQIPQDPTVYINITSKFDKEHAPNGKENWFVMINVPPLPKETEWEPILKEAKNNIIRRIFSSSGQDVLPWIETEQILHPGLIDELTGSFMGSLYGSSSNSKWAAFFRHPNFISKYPGMFFTGGSVHPGGGIPLVLKSGKIVGDFFKPVL